mmetsp:Transcript_56629/g.115950  ORF Transcript_56629/g.115950 Transcript_56629/m.115950 type:complete len:316 (-) Transcript_56629:564-1511(-)
MAAHGAALRALRVRARVPGAVLHVHHQPPPVRAGRAGDDVLLRGAHVCHRLDAQQQLRQPPPVGLGLQPQLPPRHDRRRRALLRLWRRALRHHLLPGRWRALPEPLHRPHAPAVGAPDRVDELRPADALSDHHYFQYGAHPPLCTVRAVPCQDQNPRGEGHREVQQDLGCPQKERAGGAAGPEGGGGQVLQRHRAAQRHHRPPSRRLQGGAQRRARARARTEREKFRRLLLEPNLPVAQGGGQGGEPHHLSLPGVRTGVRAGGAAAQQGAVLGSSHRRLLSHLQRGLRAVGPRQGGPEAAANACLWRAQEPHPRH